MPPDLDFSTKPTLRGHRVTLRPLKAHDVEAMAQILSDPQVRLLTGSVESSEEAAEPQSVDDRLVRWYATRGEQVDRLDLGIEDASGELVAVFESNPRGRRVYEKVGYVETGRREDALVVDGVGIAAIDMAVSAASWTGFPAGTTEPPGPGGDRR